MPDDSKAPSGNKTATLTNRSGKDTPQALENYTKVRSKVITPNVDDDATKANPTTQEPLFNQIGIAELLDQEERPVFVIDIGNPVNYAPGPLQIAYAGSSLRVQKDLVDLVQGKAEISSHAFGSTSSYAEFKAWVTSFVKDFEDLGVTLPSFSYGDVTWICTSTLRKRFRIIHGQSDSNRSSSVTAARDLTSIPQDNSSAKTMSTTSPGTQLDENVQSLSSQLDFSPQKGQNPIRPTLYRAGSSYTANLRAHRLSSKRLSGSYPAENLAASRSPLPSPQLGTEAILGFASAGDVDAFRRGFSNGEFEGFFDWTRLPLSPTLPPHIQFARGVDWQTTPLGPIEEWPSDLRGMCNLIMARYKIPSSSGPYDD